MCSGTRIARNRPLQYTYIVLCLDVCPPIQEEGDGGILTIEGSQMEGSRSILEQGYTDRQKET